MSALLVALLALVGCLLLFIAVVLASKSEHDWVLVPAGCALTSIACWVAVGWIARGVSA